jgi:hypothetical protein
MKVRKESNSTKTTKSNGPKWFMPVILATGNLRLGGKTTLLMKRDQIKIFTRNGNEL